MTIKKSTDLMRTNVIDLSDAFVVSNPTSTPLTSLLYSRGKNYSHKDILVRKKVKTLSEVASGGRKEGADAPDAEKTTYAYISNTMEIFSKSAKVSGTAGAIEGGIDKALVVEMNARLEEVKLDMEKAMINGVEVDKEDTTGRKMNGLINMVDETNIVDAETLALTEDHILDALQTMFDAGQTNGELFLMCNASTKRKINKIYQDQESTTIPLIVGDGTVGLVVSKILTDFGVVNILMSFDMATDNILLFNLNLVDVPELRTPQYEGLAVTGDSKGGFVVAEASIMTYSKALAKIVNFS